MAEPQEKEFLGKGWAFPVRLEKGQVALSRYDDDIREAIRIILGTSKGERPMRPDFGSGLQSLIFEPINSTTMTLVRHLVEEALITWEPRIDLLEVRVEKAQHRSARLDVDIRYRVRATNTFYNLVYPFYLREGQPT